MRTRLQSAANPRNKKTRMNRNVGASTETLAKTQSYENGASEPKTDVSPLCKDLVNPYISSDKKQGRDSAQSNRRNSHNTGMATSAFDTK